MVVIMGLTLPHRKVNMTNTVAGDSVATVTLNRPHLVHLGLEHVVTLLQMAYTYKSLDSLKYYNHSRNVDICWLCPPSNSKNKQFIS